MADARKVYTYSVLIDGTEANGLVLAGATIDYGSTGETRVIEPTDARLTLISRDAAPEIADEFEGITLGDHSKPSGFRDEYRDRYEGAWTQLVPWATVEVRANPVQTGFDAVYLDEYVGAASSIRFVGRIAAIDYTPAYVGLTCVSNLIAASRFEIGGTDWPAESETARARRIELEAEILLDVIGDSTAELALRKANAVPALEALANLARDCDALLWANRAGYIHYRTRTATTGTTVLTLPAEATLVDSLTMANELGRVINRVTVEYGEPRASVVESDAISIADFGHRDSRVTTGLATEAAARAYALRVLDTHARPYWRVPSVTVDLAIANSADIAGILALDLDDEVIVPTSALRGAPVTSYQARVVGYTEVLDPYAWRITLNLSPQGWTRKVAP